MKVETLFASQFLNRYCTKTVHCEEVFFHSLFNFVYLVIMDEYNLLFAYFFPQSGHIHEVHFYHTLSNIAYSIA